MFCFRTFYGNFICIAIASFAISLSTGANRNIPAFVPPYGIAIGDIAPTSHKTRLPGYTLFLHRRKTLVVPISPAARVSNGWNFRPLAIYTEHPSLFPDSIVSSSYKISSLRRVVPVGFPRIAHIYDGRLTQWNCFSTESGGGYLVILDCILETWAAPGTGDSGKLSPGGLPTRADLASDVSFNSRPRFGPSPFCLGPVG